VNLCGQSDKLITIKGELTCFSALDPLPAEGGEGIPVVPIAVPEEGLLNWTIGDRSNYPVEGKSEVEDRIETTVEHRSLIEEGEGHCIH